MLGPSGCGKSTLLRILAGLVQPTHGQVSIYGSPVDGPRDEIGIVFQKPTLLPWLNIRDNLTFPMRHKYGRVTARRSPAARSFWNWWGSRIRQQAPGRTLRRHAAARLARRCCTTRKSC